MVVRQQPLSRPGRSEHVRLRLVDTLEGPKCCRRCWLIEHPRSTRPVPRPEANCKRPDQILVMPPQSAKHSHPTGGKSLGFPSRKAAHLAKRLPVADSIIPTFSLTFFTR